MHHAAPLATCTNCKAQKVKKQDHRMCYQCYKIANPDKKKSSKKGK